MNLMMSKLDGTEETEEWGGGGGELWNREESDLGKGRKGI